MIFPSMFFKKQTSETLKGNEQNQQMYPLLMIDVQNLQNFAGLMLAYALIMS